MRILLATNFFFHTCRNFDTWVGFATIIVQILAVSVEISTGKNFVANRIREKFACLKNIYMRMLLTIS